MTNAYITMALRDPHGLLALVRGPMPSHELTFAAEALGHVHGLSVWLEIGKLLEHESPLVREGAVYGAGCGYTDILGEQLRHMAEADPSAGVRAAAREVMAP